MGQNYEEKNYSKKARDTTPFNNYSEFVEWYVLETTLLIIREQMYIFFESFSLKRNDKVENIQVSLS